MTTTKTLSSVAQCAKAIREELKSQFPDIKFSVKSDSFSMGDSVDVRYYDGVPTCKVEAITNKYQYGHFNGMEDMYENSNSRDDIPQSKFVHIQRTLTAEIKLKVVQAIEKKYQIKIGYEVEYDDYHKKDMLKVTDDSWLDGFNCWTTALISREVHEMAI